MTANLAVVQERRPAASLHISASALRCLQECPREFCYRYISGCPKEDMSSAMILGAAIHLAAAAFYEALKSQQPVPETEALKILAKNSIGAALDGETPVLFSKGETAESLMAAVDQLVEIFVADAFRPAKILGVEMKFVVPIVHPKTGEVVPQFQELLLGFFDLVAEDEAGDLMIVDHKVSRRCAPPKSTRLDTQLQLYALAAEELFQRPVKLFHQTLVRNKTPRIVLTEVPRAPRDTTEAVEALWSALKLIHLAVSHPERMRLLGRRRTWRCGGCGYRKRCEASTLKEKTFDTHQEKRPQYFDVHPQPPNHP